MAERRWQGVVGQSVIVTACCSGAWLLSEAHDGLSASDYWWALAFGVVVGLPQVYFGRPDRTPVREYLDRSTPAGAALRRRARSATGALVLGSTVGGLSLLLQRADGLHTSDFVVAGALVVLCPVLMMVSGRSTRAERAAGEAKAVRAWRRRHPRPVAKVR